MPNRLGRTPRKATKLLGRKLAGHVVAIARSRIGTLEPTQFVDPAIVSDRRGDQHPKQGEVARILRKRWISERPFEGTSSQTLQRKLLAGVLNPRARASALRELSRRGEKVVPE